uniref:Ig-like domain-containing protein n=1 Tax=Gadus morhua TaxID=8049 RepID=A0A8C5CUU9_GADMO
SRQFCGLILVQTLSMGNSLKTLVTQPREDVISTEGLTVTLECTFETISTNVYLFWYKQQIKDFPRFILRRFTIGEGNNAADSEHIPDSRYQSTTSRTSTELTITRITLADTALYYCVLQRHSDIKCGGAFT